MNGPQELWWQQASSDHRLLLSLRRIGAEPCHQLHYLQMVTEKLAKAYLWREGRPPARSHRAFINFLRAILSRSKSDRSRIAHLLGYNDANQLDAAVRRITPTAYALERLAPALAGDHGPNPEYPWPGDWPIDAPTTHRFAVWDDLTQTNAGRSLIRLIDQAVPAFPRYC